MLYRGLKIGVFYKDKSWAKKWFNDFINTIDNACILRKVRGTCIDKAFVEHTVGSEIIDSVIRPLLGHTIFIEIED